MKAASHGSWLYRLPRRTDNDWQPRIDLALIHALSALPRKNLFPWRTGASLSEAIRKMTQRRKPRLQDMLYLSFVLIQMYYV